MWVKVESMEDLRHGDKVRGVCRDGLTREGVINLERLPTELLGKIAFYEYGFDYAGHVILNSNWVCSPYNDDIHIGNCEVWR